MQMLFIYVLYLLQQLSSTLKRKLLEQQSPGDYSSSIAFQVAVLAGVYIKPDLPHVFAFLRDEWTTLYEENKTKPVAAGQLFISLIDFGFPCLTLFSVCS